MGFLVKTGLEAAEDSSHGFGHFLFGFFRVLAWIGAGAIC